MFLLNQSCQDTLVPTDSGSTVFLILVQYNLHYVRIGMKIGQNDEASRDRFFRAKNEVKSFKVKKKSLPTTKRLFVI